jgi:putative tryptophan/tyrosine transport system substrate-binding protein
MKRREFIAGLGGAAAWPLAARAQQGAMPVIGWLAASSREGAAQTVSGIREGLIETGFVEGRNLRIEYRWADNHYERLAGLAADLVHLRVAVIVAIPARATLAARAATATIPIVFSIGGDPVEQLGLVASYNRPGGNLTGVTFYTSELWGKRVGLMHEILPAVSGVAALVNPNSAGAERAVRSAQDAARALALQILIVNASTEGEVDAAFARLVQQRAGALFVQGEPFLISRRDQIIALAARHAIPASFPNPVDSVAGGLISYGISRANQAELLRQIGIYAGRILNGEKPGDLPIMQPTRYELVANLKTARALGLTIPESFLARADEVIE